MSVSEWVSEPGERAVVVGRSHRRGPVALERGMLLMLILSSKGQSLGGEAAPLSGLGSGRSQPYTCVLIEVEETQGTAIQSHPGNPQALPRLVASKMIEHIP